MKPIELSPDDPGPCVILGLAEHKRHRPLLLRGSRRYHCYRCNGHVWLAQSSQERLERYPDTTTILCHRCFIRAKLEGTLGQVQVAIPDDKSLLRDLNGDEGKLREVRASIDKAK